MPTTLAAGDLAIVGASADAKTFAFVLLTDVEAGTQINFTDNGWLAAGGFRGGEGVVTWTASGHIAAGTVIVFSGVGSNGFTGSASFNNATAGDQIIAYQGAASAATQAIYAFDYADSNTSFAGDATSSNTSAIPTGLAMGTTAFAIGEEDVAYIGPTSGTKEYLLQQIGNLANWTGSDTVIPAYPTAFSVGAAGQTISIAPGLADQAEGDSGLTAFTFIVTRSDAAGAASVDWSVTGIGNTGQAATTDFAATAGSVSFAAGETSKTVTVQVKGDTDVETDETFSVTLTNPSAGYLVGTATAGGVIRNDDTAPTVVGTPWINEFHYDNPGTDVGEFIEVAGPAGLDLSGYTLVLYNGNGGASYGTINLSGIVPNQQNGVGVLTFATPGIQNGSPDGMALVGPGGVVIEFLSYEGTFVAANGPAAGMTSIEVGVIEDASADGTSIARTGAGGEGADFAWTLSNDDTPGAINGGQVFETPTARVRITDASVTEGDSGTKLMTFTVTRSGPGQAFEVSYSTADGTATAGSDYVATSGTLSFAAGETSKTISVTINGDTVVEPTETLFVNLFSPTNGATLGDAQGLGKILADDVATLKIYDIQGAGHISPYVGQEVITDGIVTAIDTTGARGFWIQDPNGDGDNATSDGIFIFVGSTGLLDVAVGDHVQVRGVVDEFGTGNNLTTTEIIGPTITKIGVGSIAPTILGAGGRMPPTEVIGDDEDAFDPSTQAMDFYESLEGMLVTVPNAQAVDISSGGGTWVVANAGAGATGMNDRGGVTISGTDMNPERVQVFVDSGVYPGGPASFDMGDRLGDVTGVVSYFGGNYELVATNIANPVGPGSPPDDVTDLVGDASHLTMAAYNLENIDPTDPQAKFDALAADIVGNLRGPDIIGIEEVQDADGPGQGANLSGALTAQKLIDAIVAAGGPHYVYVEVAPATAGTSGGEGGGNIRNGFLYNPDRVQYVDGSARLVDPDNAAFAGSRKPLAADFVFRGETITAIDVHSTSRLGGDQGLFGDRQPPVNGGESQRIAQSQAVHDYVVALQQAHPDQHVAVMGDFNGFQFEQSLTLLEQGGSLTNLSWSLAPEERYSYVFDGNAQQIDHMLVSQGLSANAQFDIVHLNSGVAGFRPTDHDPVLGRFFVNTAPVANAETYQGAEDVALTVDAAHGLLANDSDRNGDAMTAVLETGPAHGSLTLNADGSFTYLGAANYNGADSFTYRTKDAFGGVSDLTTVTLQVASVNDAPVAVADAAAVSEKGTVVIDVLANDTDVDLGDGKTIVGVSSTALGGHVSIVDGKLVYAADADAFDLLLPGLSVTDTFTYTVADTAGATSTATVSVVVSGVANGPTQSAGNGNDTVNGTAADEVLYGGNGNDKLFGFGGADVLFGGNGNDTLSGGKGIDALSGDNGNDLLDGGDGADVLSGGNGNDTLIGGAGNDLLTGGNGNDRFVFGVGFGNDVVVDFDRGSDKIQLDHNLFANYADVMAHAKQILGAVVITYDGDNSITLLDTTLSSLKSSDFLFV